MKLKIRKCYERVAGHFYMASFIHFNGYGGRGLQFFTLRSRPQKFIIKEYKLTGRENMDVEMKANEKGI